MKRLIRICSGFCRSPVDYRRPPSLDGNAIICYKLCVLNRNNYRRIKGSLKKSRVHKNSFIEGAITAYFVIILSKILGALYSIPFYSIIGTNGGVIYSCSYNIYNIFLSIATSGIPIAISIVISEYNSLKMYKTSQKVTSLASKLVFAAALISFIFLQIFAPAITRYLLGDMTQGVPPDEISAGIRAISYCLLIVPFLSIMRGFLQGNKFITLSSNSQLVEQISRIAIILIGSYISIVVLKMPVVVGVCIALLGAAFGAAVALLYLKRRSRHLDEQLHPAPLESEVVPSNKEIIIKIFSYCATLVLVSVATSLYEMMDLKLLLTGLHNLHYTDNDAQVISSMHATWIPRIGMIITSVSMGITTSIMPHMAENSVTGNHKKIVTTVNQALGTIFLIAVPLSIGIIICSEPIFRLFYGYGYYGSPLVRLNAITSVFFCVSTTLEMLSQGLDLGKRVCVCVIIGVVINAGMDIPFIYLLDYLGLKSYLGAGVSTIFGQSITIFLLAIPLVKKFGLKPAVPAKLFVRVLISALIMGAFVILLRYLIPIADGRNVLFVLELSLYGIAGAAVYGFITLKTGIIAEVIGQENQDKILTKLHLKK